MFKIPETIKRVESASPVVYPQSHLVRSTADVVISDANVEMVIQCNGYYSVVTPAPRDPALDITIDCLSFDSSGTAGQGILTAKCSMIGEWLNVVIFADAFNVSLALSGLYVSGVVASGLFEVLTVLKPGEDCITFATPVKTNWVSWSDIGNLDFTIGKSNVAGERPLDWKGYIYAIKKLLGKVIVYGENGVSFLVPSGSNFGLDTIYRIGLKGICAVAGDEAKQFFVDNSGKLWKISGGLTLLNYAEYLSELNSNVVVSYDKLNNLIYICDGSVGYVYDAAAGSLGRCSPNITGIDYQSGVRYVTASADITTDPFEICTDIYDLENRTGKTVFSLEFGTDLVTDLYAAVDWRRSKAVEFTQTPWYRVSSDGKINIIAYGREFRIRVKTLEYEYFELDYIKINGVIDAY